MNKNALRILAIAAFTVIFEPMAIAQAVNPSSRQEAVEVVRETHELIDAANAHGLIALDAVASLPEWVPSSYATAPAA